MIIPTNLAVNATLSDVTSLATASISPNANALILVTVRTFSAGGTAPTVTASGNGITYAEIANKLSGDNHLRITILRGLSISPTSEAITASFATSNGASISVEQFINVNTTGINGAGAIVQSNSTTAVSATALTVTLNAFDNINNVTFGGFVNDSTGAFVKGDNFIQLSLTSTEITEWASSNQTSVNVTCAISPNLNGIAIEIAALQDMGLLQDI